jgi:ferredoxin--NADP+ reductase
LPEIVSQKELAPKIKLFEIKSPEISDKARPGQFIIMVTEERGERIPLTIADINREKGTISFVFNEVGKTTKQLGHFRKGDIIPNVLGPLGTPSDIKNFGKVLCVAGGVMIGPMLLQVRALRKAGNSVTTVMGARIKKLLFFEGEMKTASHKFYAATDDGSEGYHGLGFLKDVVSKEKFDRCVAMGPVVMMKSVCEYTKPAGIPTVVTLMPIMVDGMGMCGACRVTVGGETKFGCVDGPEFNGHLVDFDELIKRQRMFLPEERLSSLLWEKVGGEVFG